MVAVSIVSGVAAAWAASWLLRLVYTWPGWRRWEDWFLVPAALMQLLALGLVGAEVAGRPSARLWLAVLLMWAVGLVVLGAVAGRPDPDASDPSADHTGSAGLLYGFALLIGITYMVMGVSGQTVPATVGATLVLVAVGFVVRGVRDLRVPRPSAAVLEQYGDGTMPEDARRQPEDVWAPGPDAARPVRWPVWPDSPTAWFLDAVQDPTGPTGELPETAELEERAAFFRQYAGAAPSDYAAVGPLPDRLDSTRRYWAEVQSRLTRGATALWVGGMTALGVAGASDGAVFCWALGLITVGILTTIVESSPRMRQLSLIHRTLARISQGIVIPSWDVPERWQTITVPELTAAVPPDTSHRMVCAKCGGTGSAPTRHRQDVLVEPEHTSQQWVPNVGSEGGREVTMHHAARWRTEWVADPCPACEGEGTLRGPWTPRDLSAQAAAVVAVVQRLANARPQIQAGIRERNQRLVQAQAAVKQWQTLPGNWTHSDRNLSPAPNLEAQPSERR
jgi:hypothetical protein